MHLSLPRPFALVTPRGQPVHPRQSAVHDRRFAGRSRGLEAQGSYWNRPHHDETWFPGGNGKMNSSGVRACLQHWIDTGATVLIPIDDVTSDMVGGNNGANNLAYHIEAVAAVVLTAIDQPAVDQITARFVDYYPLTQFPAAVSISSPGADDITAFVGLVK